MVYPRWKKNKSNPPPKEKKNMATSRNHERMTNQDKMKWSQVTQTNNKKHIPPPSNRKCLPKSKTEFPFPHPKNQLWYSFLRQSIHPCPWTTPTFTPSKRAWAQEEIRIYWLWNDRLIIKKDQHYYPIQMGQHKIGINRCNQCRIIMKNTVYHSRSREER